MAEIYDYSKLNGRIIEKCGNRTEFLRKMGWSERTNGLKLSNRIPWTQDQILKACEILDIKVKDIPTYFFTVKVA